MSRPENPLAKYRSYSYHHILVACDSTTTAQILAQSPVFSDTLRFAERSERKGESLIKTISGNVEGIQVSGSYAVVINTMVDSDFIIDSVRWSTIFTPSTMSEESMGAEQFTVVTVEGTMEIREPLGVMFINTLTDIFDGLRVDPAGIVFMLKTIFTGHTSSGSIETIHNISPFLFVLFDLTGYFDVIGAGYTLMFGGIENGVTRLPQIARVAQGTSIKLTKENNTIKAAAEKLQNVINEAYTTFVKELKDDMAKQNQRIFGPDGPGKKVGYIIQIDDAYKDYTITEQTTSQKENPDDPGIISLGKDEDIESAIHNIMRKSNKVLEDEKGIVDEATKKMRRHGYRITSAMESGAVAVAKYGSMVNDKEIEYFFIYKVTRYQVPFSTHDGILEGDESSVAAGNKIEFDYFFTGQNTDILEFDLKMQMGLAFLYSVATTKNMHNTASATLKGDYGNKTTVPGSTGLSAAIRHNTPILFSSNSDNALIRNSVHSLNAVNFQALLSRFAALEGLQAKITITGNPRLLANTLSSPPTTPNEVEEEDVLLNWRTQPGFAKVNIRFPTAQNTRDPKSFNYGDYSEPFWYRGFYFIFQVDNIFEGGEFKQTLDMMSIPTEPFFEQADESEKKDEPPPAVPAAAPVGTKTPTSAKPSLSVEERAHITRSKLQLQDILNQFIARGLTEKKIGTVTYTVESLQKRIAELNVQLGIHNEGNK